MANKNIIIDSTREERIEFLVADIDAFDNKPAKTYASAGHHIVRLLNWELVPEKEVATRTDLYITKPYILLDLKDAKTGEVFETRLYQNFLQYFKDQIAAQTDGANSGMGLKDTLTYLSKNDFECWVSYDKRYGVQVSYQEPRK